MQWEARPSGAFCTFLGLLSHGSCLITRSTPCWAGASQGRAGSCFLLHITAHLGQDPQDGCAVGVHRMNGCWVQRSSQWESLLFPPLGVVFLISPTPHNFKFIDHRRSLVIDITGNMATEELMEANIVVEG